MRHVLDSRQALGLTRLHSFLAPAFALSAALLVASPAFAADSCPTLLNHSFPSLQDQKPQSLCQWQGKVLLVVNTASYCGFTSQYDGLEKLYARLKDRGLVVVGFPSNDFGDQEPGSNQEIAEFCRLTYGVQFPMFAKATVVGRNASHMAAKWTPYSRVEVSKVSPLMASLCTPSKIGRVTGICCASTRSPGC